MWQWCRLVEKNSGAGSQVMGKGKPGHKKIDLDPAEIEALAAEGLAEYQIATRLGVCQDTLTERKKESTEIRESLIDDPRYSTVAIWYSTAQMGWKERQVIEHEGEISIGGARERLAKKLGCWQAVIEMALAAIRDFVASLSDEEALILLYDWQFWTRSTRRLATRASVGGSCG